MINSKWNKSGRQQPWPTVRFYEGITKDNEMTYIRITGSSVRIWTLDLTRMKHNRSALDRTMRFVHTRRLFCEWTVSGSTKCADCATGGLLKNVEELARNRLTTPFSVQWLWRGPHGEMSIRNPFCYPQRPYRLWGPRSFLFDGYRR